MVNLINRLIIPEHVKALFQVKEVMLAHTINDLLDLSLQYEQDGVQKVIFDVPGKGEYCEAIVNSVKNGISVNYTERYMLRHNLDSIVIGNDLLTDKVTYKKRFGNDFAELKKETFD